MKITYAVDLGTDDKKFSTDAIFFSIIFDLQLVISVQNLCIRGGGGVLLIPLLVRSVWVREKIS